MLLFLLNRLFILKIVDTVVVSFHSKVQRKTFPGKTRKPCFLFMSVTKILVHIILIFCLNKGDYILKLQTLVIRFITLFLWKGYWNKSIFRSLSFLIVPKLSHSSFFQHRSPLNTFLACLKKKKSHICKGFWMLWGKSAW